MLDRLAVWRHKPALWAVPLAFVAANILILVLFQTAFAGRVDALKLRYDKQAQRLERLQTESERAERFNASLEAQRNAGAALYDNHFASEGERFTGVIREVRDKAREAGMDPLSYAYPEQVVDDYGLTRRGINFSVSGTYEQLRRYINLLELSDEFIALEAVHLGEVKGARGGNADPRLSVRLRLSTMFVDTEYVAQADSRGLEEPSPGAGEQGSEDEEI